MKPALLAIAVALASICAFAQADPQPKSSKWALVEELVLANRILFEEGILDAYGHVSVRDPENPNHFLLARHLAANVVTASDIIEYDFDAKPVNGDPSTGYTERFIHSEIYRARPDVMAVVHTHAADLIPFTVTSVPLRPIYHMGGFLGEGVPVFEIRKAGGMTDMLIRSSELGRALANTLGKKPAVLLRGHGAVVVAPSLHMVTGRAYYMNLNARLQWQAMQMGGAPITFLDPEEASKASAQDGYERAWASGKQRVQSK